MAFEATKREWGELYAFFRLLADGYVQAGKADGTPNEEVRWPVAMVQREEHDGTRQYIIEEQDIHICGEKIDKLIPREDFDAVAHLVLEAVRSSRENDVTSPASTNGQRRSCGRLQRMLGTSSSLWSVTVILRPNASTIPSVGPHLTLLPNPAL